MESVLKDINPVLQMLIVMTVFSLLPFVFSCMTSFLRFVIVFSMLKTAISSLMKEQMKSVFSGDE